MIRLGGIHTVEALASEVQGPKQGDKNSKIESSARDFESLLLSSWLQEAYQSFGTVPGMGEGQDLDSGKEQFQSIAMQSLGSSMAASGGIGIARMITEHLHRKVNAAETDSAADRPENPHSLGEK